MCFFYLIKQENVNFFLDPARTWNFGFVPDNSDQNRTDGHQDNSKEFSRSSESLFDLTVSDKFSKKKKYFSLLLIQT